MEERSGFRPFEKGGDDVHAIVHVAQVTTVGREFRSVDGPIGSLAHRDAPRRMPNVT